VSDTVLVIDDNREFTETLCADLRRRGYAAHAAYSGAATSPYPAHGGSTLGYSRQSLESILSGKVDLPSERQTLKIDESNSSALTTFHILTASSDFSGLLARYRLGPLRDVLPGLLLLGLSLLGAYNSRSAAARWLILALAFGFLSLGPCLVWKGQVLFALPSAWLYENISPLALLRPVRHVLALTLCLSMAAAFCLPRWGSDGELHAGAAGTGEAPPGPPASRPPPPGSGGSKSGERNPMEVEAPAPGRRRDLHDPAPLLPAGMWTGREWMAWLLAAALLGLQAMEVFGVHAAHYSVHLASAEVPPYYQRLAGASGAGAMIEVPLTPYSQQVGKTLFYQSVHRRPLLNYNFVRLSSLLRLAAEGRHNSVLGLLLGGSPSLRKSDAGRLSAAGFRHLDWSVYVRLHR